MVRAFHSAVNVSSIGRKFFRAEHLVDAHKDGVAIKRAAEASARTYVSVGQIFAHAAIGVGNRSVVEIAANYHWRATMPVNEGRYLVGHSGACGCGVRNLGENRLRALPRNFRFGSVYHLFELFAILS